MTMAPDDGIEGRSGWAWLYWMGLIVVVVSAIGPFAHIPGFFFTKTGVEEILVSARISSLEDVRRILVRPILSEVRADTIYYRPVSTLSLSLDFALWGYRAAGYQAVDLLLHAAVAGLLFHLAYRLSGRSVSIGLVTGILYTLHPITVEIVPAVAHRQQTLMAMFLLIGLVASVRHVHRDGGGGWLAVALGSFLLSVGAKETGIVFLPLVLAYLLLDGSERSWGLRIFRALRRWLPYALAGLLYVLWWGWVTRARAFVGGGTSMQPPILRRTVFRTLYLQVVEYPLKNVPSYFEALFHPLKAGSGTGIGAGFGLVALVLTFAAILILRPWSWASSDSETKPLVGMQDPPLRTLAFSLVWLFILPVFFSVTNTYPGYKRSYVGVLPLSLMAAAGLTVSLKLLGMRFRSTLAGRNGHEDLGEWGSVVTSGLMVLLVGYFILGTAAMSPLLNDYPAWDHTQDVTGRYYRALFEELEKLPPGSRVELVGVPRWMGQSRAFPHSGGFTYLLRPGPMVRWRFPEARFAGLRWSYRDVFTACPCPLNLETERLGSHRYVVITRFEDPIGNSGT